MRAERFPQVLLLPPYADYGIDISKQVNQEGNECLR